MKLFYSLAFFLITSTVTSQIIPHEMVTKSLVEIKEICEINSNVILEELPQELIVFSKGDVISYLHKRGVCYGFVYDLTKKKLDLLLQQNEELGYRFNRVTSFPCSDDTPILSKEYLLKFGNDGEILQIIMSKSYYSCSSGGSYGVVYIYRTLYDALNNL
jgi:hypothetical protein